MLGHLVVAPLGIKTGLSNEELARYLAEAQQSDGKGPLTSEESWPEQRKVFVELLVALSGFVAMSRLVFKLCSHYTQFMTMTHLGQGKTLPSPPSSPLHHAQYYSTKGELEEDCISTTEVVHG
eukprot:6480738-Amphidinium_carterae.2